MDRKGEANKEGKSEMKFIRAVPIKDSNRSSLCYAKPTEPRELLHRLLSMMERAEQVTPDEMVLAVIREVDSWDVLYEISNPGLTDKIIEAATEATKKVGL